nr:retrovirus-related Pol polyprotein from transposon TNT 1-94 [Tanacetum cinerariifolium]
MTTLADKAILSGADNCPPMLEKDIYDSWKSIMELYMLNRQHGRMILESVENDPLLWPTVEENGATNIILQGLSPEVYALVSNHKVTKELWERIQLLMQGTSLTKQEREKVLVITALKDTLSKLKGKPVVNEVVPLHPIDPELLIIDVAPLATKLQNNRTTHYDYLKHTQEETATLREIVKNERLLNPLNTSLDYVCKYTKRIQELLIILKQTCPCINDLGTKLMAVTPVNNNKKIRFIEHISSSGNTPIKITSSINIVSNKPVLSSTGVNLLTSASRSQPQGNTKKDRIQQTQSRAKKNKLEDHPRNVRPSLHNKKSVVNTKAISSVPNSKLNVNSDLKCATYNGCLFSDNHDSCVLEFINSVNARCPNCSLIFGLRMLQAHDRRPLSAHQLRIEISRQCLVRGLPKLKFEKDHLCSACAMGKSKKKSHKPKSEDTNQEKLYLLHMDLCGPMRVESVNGMKYILVIVDDYSRFTWVKCLRSKDEAPDFIIKFLKMIQVRLKVPVCHIRTDNGTKFVNQTMREYYEQVGISHETSVARSPQENGVIERRNYTLIEAARTMLIYAQASLFLWAESPALHEMTPATISSGLVPKPSSSTPYVPPSRNDWDLLFQPLFDELLTPPPSVNPPTHEVIAPIADVIPLVQAESIGSPSSTTVDQDAPSLSKSQTTPETQSPVIPQDVEEDIHDIEVAHMGNDPLFGMPIPEVASDQSSSTIQVAQKKVKIAFENADSSSRVELIPSKIKYANKIVLIFHKEFLVFSSLSRKGNDGLLQDQVF